MTEEGKKGKTVTESVTEVGTDKSTEKIPYICSVCGAEVVPIKVQKPDGRISYRCPECGKFMKPLTPEDVKEKEEEEGGYADPYDQMIKKMADKLLKDLPRIPNVTAPKARAIVSDFREDKALRESERELYYLIKDYCPSAKPGLLGRVFSIQDEYANVMSEQVPISIPVQWICTIGVHLGTV